MKRYNEVIKYRIFWIIGTIFSFILYFSGIIWLYTYFRKKVLRHYITMVITYHRVRDDDTEPDISVSTENFKRQIAYLKDRFNVISLKEVVGHIGKESDMSRDNIAITFDDGYKDIFLNAYPILQQYKFPATIFLISSLIGARENILNIDELKIMKDKGIDFGSHTDTHKMLTEVDIDTAADEISHSKEELENVIDNKIYFFAYPKGKRDYFNERIKTQIMQSGYKAAFTTENDRIRNGDDLFELKRIGIRNCPLFVFKVRVSGIFESRLVYFIRNLFKLT